jgi:hypothetical protein
VFNDVVKDDENEENLDKCEPADQEGVMSMVPLSAMIEFQQQYSSFMKVPQ